jgi:hypothetical protein
MSDPGSERPDERPGEQLVVPGNPGRRDDADVPADVRDLGSASRSCLVIIVILVALVLFACAAIAIRAVVGG